MDGIRYDITFVESAARALGVPWCEYVLVGVNSCASVVIEYMKACQDGS